MEFSITIGQWIIHKEEEGLIELDIAADVPASARISVVDQVWKSGERKGILKYYQGPSRFELKEQLGNLVKVQHRRQRNHAGDVKSRNMMAKLIG